MQGSKCHQKACCGSEFTLARGVVSSFPNPSGLKIMLCKREWMQRWEPVAHHRLKTSVQRKSRICGREGLKALSRFTATHRSLLAPTIPPSPCPTQRTSLAPHPYPGLRSGQYNWIAGLVEGSAGSPLHLVDKCDLFFPTLGCAYRLIFLSQRHLEILHYIMSCWWLQEYDQNRVSWMAPSWMLMSTKTEARLTVLPTPICCGYSLLSLHLALIALPKK